MMGFILKMMIFLDIASIISGLLLPACRAARSEPPAEIPMAEFERDAANMVRRNGPKGPAAAGEWPGLPSTAAYCTLNGHVVLEFFIGNAEIMENCPCN